MLMQTGVEAQIETLIALASTTNFQAAKKLNSLHELKPRYRLFLSSLSQRIIAPHEREPAYTSTPEETRRLAALFSNDSALDDKLQSDVITEADDPEHEQKRMRVHDALCELARYSPSYAELFNTVVTDIFISPSTVARAGSTSGAVGAIWMNPKLSYPVFDLMEMLVHEFTHQAMFLDELRHGHYVYGAIADRSTWAKSAILNISRPLDKVLHSIVVAAEVLLLRREHIGQPAAPRAHPPTDIMLEQLDESLSSIEAVTRRLPEILKPRANTIVANVRCILNDRLRSSQAELISAGAQSAN